MLSANELANKIAHCFSNEENIFILNKYVDELKGLIESEKTSTYEITLVAFGLLAVWGWSRDQIDSEMKKWIEHFDARPYFPFTTGTNY